MAVVLLVLGALFFVNTYVVFNAVRAGEAHGRIVNLAGRQRMLVQTALLDARRVGEGDDEARWSLADALAAVDSAFADLAGERPGAAPPASVRPALEAAIDSWEDQRAQFEAVRRAPAGSLQMTFALASAEAAAPYVLEDIEAMVQAYQGAFQGQVARGERLVVAMAALGAVIAGASWWWMYARLTGPLHRLREGARRLASGEFHLRLDHGGPDEIGALAREFNIMAERLERAYGDLADHAARLEAANTQLQERASRDSLTGALNHGAVEETLAQLAVEGFQDGRAAVAVVDVDGMKATNDTYGHTTGDGALVRVASALRRPGAIVGRYGGDEFVVILNGSDRTQAERYRDEVLEDLARASVTDPASGATVPVQVTIGIAVYPDDAGDARDLVALADAAMYFERRQRRASGRGKRSLSRSLGDDLAARTIGEIVPLLVGPGDLEEKLRLVAHRVAVGAGYDGVDVRLLENLEQAPVSHNTFVRAPDALIDAWSREQLAIEDHPIRRLVRETRAPVIVDEPAEDERMTEGQRALLAAAGFHSAIVAPMFSGDDLVGLMSVASRRRKAFGPKDAAFLLTVATQVAGLVRTEMLVEELRRASRRLEEAHTETVMMLAAAAEARDHVTGQHLRTIRSVAEALARELGYPEREAADIGLAAVLHDIGKIRMPDAVLASARPFNAAERAVMSRHTQWGYELLDGRPGFELAARVARWHHERWDGSGYPDGLAGDGIPEPVCIVAVADALDAMTGRRPYRRALDLDEALAEIERNAGTQFAPRVVEALLRLRDRSELPLGPALSEAA